MMITDQLYEKYLNSLLGGERAACTGIVRDLVDQKIDLKYLYTDLFQKSLYTVGELWEANRITVAKEHLATAITEGLLNLAYPQIFEGARGSKSVVVSCAANEYHQVGGKMVADIFEMNGWNGYFLGANTPVEQLLSFVDEVKPDLVGLSLSIYFNSQSLKNCIDALKTEFPSLDIIVGGQAFRWSGESLLQQYQRVDYISTLADLEQQIKAA